MFKTAIISILILASTNAYAGNVVDIARSQLGRGEVGGDNRGTDVMKYTRGKEIPWCAAYVSWVMTKAGKLKGIYILSARQYWNMKDKRVTNPQPGDVICFWRVSKNSWNGHVGIVEKIDGNKITVIEGNSGDYPAKVKRLTYTMGHIDKLLGFVRL